MKLSHIIIIFVILADIAIFLWTLWNDGKDERRFFPLLLVLFLAGCTHIPKSELGNCVRFSRHIVARERSFGKQMRYGVGYMSRDKMLNQKKTHQWAEWFNEKRQEWCLWDYSGKSWYTAKETGYITILTSKETWRSPSEIKT